MTTRIPSPRAALRLASAALLTLTGTFLAGANAQAQTKGVVSLTHAFTGSGDFVSTRAPIKATDGNFYGCSYDGGHLNSGFIYKLTPTGTFSVLHTFQNDGSVENDPLEGEKPKELIQGTDGNLYGICRGGGAEINTGGVGTFFKLTLSGTFTKLYDFDNGDTKAGAFPSAIIQGRDGNFYGLTRDGGKTGISDGTYFKIVTNGTKAGTTRTELFAFASGNGPGYTPEAQLIVGSDGNFYGMTEHGGSTGGAGSSGTIFKATTAGAVTPIHVFAGDGAPLGHTSALLQGSDGNLYGTSGAGGDKGFGTIFRCSLSGNYLLLHDFEDPQVDGTSPACALVQGADGNYYGSVNEAFYHDPVDIVDGPGGYFQLTPSGAFSIIYKFTETSGAPKQPFDLVQITPGVFYGLTNGGTNGDGAIVKLVTSPTIVSATSANATIGVAFNYGIRTGQTVSSYSATGLPAGLAFSTTTGAISGKPTTAGTYNVTLKATNSAGTGSIVLKIVVTAPKPVITSALTATATQGTAFSYTITASNSPTSYGASGLPTGLTLSTSTGKITGTPTAAPGTYSVTIAAFNSAGSGSAKLALTLKGAPPVVTSASTGTATVGTAYSYQIVATNTPTSYGASGLPTGLSVSTSTGKISGTPTKAGTFSVTIAAFNATGHGSKVLTLTVKAAAAKPVITSSLSASARQGVAFAYQITATNSPTSYGASGLPTGLTINQTTGKISGTPTKAGTYTPTLAAFNAAGSGTAKLTLVVKDPL